MTEFKIPELGENVASGDVTRVLVNVGDTIALDQPVLELETDKATIEVPSSVAGVVKEIKVKKGDKVKVGAVVLTVDAPPTARRRRLPQPPAPAPAPAAPEPPQAAAPASARQHRRQLADRSVTRRADAGEVGSRGPAQPAAPVKLEGERGPAAPASPAVQTSGARDRRRHQRRAGYRCRADASRRKTSRNTRDGS